MKNFLQYRDEEPINTMALTSIPYTIGPDLESEKLIFGDQFHICFETGSKIPIYWTFDSKEESDQVYEVLMERLVEKL
tara:strand:+ start:173 stop:406 length:234 start_codon:yes stop_codon:yes gene_type:complete